MSVPHYQNLIVGAGVIGSSIAHALSEKSLGNTLVIDPSLKGERSSSELNAGGVRATWGQEHHIEASRVTIDFFEKHKDSCGYLPVGYLWLKNQKQLESSAHLPGLWRQFGWKVDVLSRSGLQDRHPWMDRCEDIAEGWFAPRDGLVNPNLVKSLYRNFATASGKVLFRDRTVLLSASVVSSQKIEVELGFLRLQQQDYTESLQRSRADIVSPDKVFEKIEKVTAERIINCAGPWAKVVCSRLGYSRPVKAIRRQISLFDCRTVRSSSMGMIVDTSGVYFHPEADYFLSGFADPAEPESYSFAYDSDDFFNEKIWMPLSERSSHFESLRHVTGWAGLYEVSPDENAFVGSVSDSSFLKSHQLYEAHSFSGHGVMHSYAIAQQLALEISGENTASWYKPLSCERAKTGQWNHENAVI